MKVSHERHLDIARFDGRNLSFKSSSLGTTHYAWSKIDEVGAIINNDGRCRTGTIRVGHRCAGAEKHNSRTSYGFSKSLGWSRGNDGVKPIHDRYLHGDPMIRKRMVGVHVLLGNLQIADLPQGFCQ